MTGLPLANRAGKALGQLTLAWRQPASPTEHALRLLDLLLRQVGDMQLGGEAQAPDRKPA